MPCPSRPARSSATNSADTMADGMAVRGPDAEALAVILKGADRIVQVSDAGDRRRHARLLRGHATSSPRARARRALAALLQERERMQGRRVGLILSGGNIDRPLYLRVLAGA